MAEDKLKYWYGRYVNYDEWERMYGKKEGEAQPLPSDHFLDEVEEKLIRGVEMKEYICKVLKEWSDKKPRNRMFIVQKDLFSEDYAIALAVCPDEYVNNLDRKKYVKEFTEVITDNDLIMAKDPYEFVNDKLGKLFKYIDTIVELS